MPLRVWRTRPARSASFNTWLSDVSAGSPKSVRHVGKACRMGGHPPTWANQHSPDGDDNNRSRNGVQSGRAAANGAWPDAAAVAPADADADGTADPTAPRTAADAPGLTGKAVDQTK